MLFFLIEMLKGILVSIKTIVPCFHTSTRLGASASHAFAEEEVLAFGLHLGAQLAVVHAFIWHGIR
jgi:hypothetical protein